MKNPILKILSLIILLTVFSLAVKAQSTNVSGGIYTNTTWTLANSPYIVTDTVVVFPGVTLTIEPGVVVKFDDNMRLEIRQATLIAQGTASDSITFTSNSALPTHGIWSEIYINNCSNMIKFNYCNIQYAINGIFHYDSETTIKNSKFNNNNIGIKNYSAIINFDSCDFNNNYRGIYSNGPIYLNYCNIKNNIEGIISSIVPAFIFNCNISNNQIGMSFYEEEFKIVNTIIDSNSVKGILDDGCYGDSIVYCEIKYNGIGIYNREGTSCVIVRNVIENNNIGIKLTSSLDNIYCNKICNNTSYDLYDSIVGGSNFNFSNNYWCSSDSATIASHIYDGYDNINLGLVNFMPIDTSSCYLITENPKNEFESFSFNIYPNPASDYLTLRFTQNTPKATIKIYNLLGELKSVSMISRQEAKINISDLSSGIYILEAATERGIIRQKFIKQ